MEFNEAISIVEQKLNKIGIPISTGQFDGIIVKKLAESNPHCHYWKTNGHFSFPLFECLF